MKKLTFDFSRFNNCSNAGEVAKDLAEAMGYEVEEKLEGVYVKPGMRVNHKDGDEDIVAPSGTSKYQSSTTLSVWEGNAKLVAEACHNYTYKGKPVLGYAKED